MKCPYCGHDMGDLPVEAIRASMRGQRMLEIFDLIVEAGDKGAGLTHIVSTVYGAAYRSDAFNAAKVTIIRLKERVKQYGWTIESGSSQSSAHERVYRIKKEA